MKIVIQLLADGLIIPIVLISAYALIFKIPKNQRFETYKYIFLAGLTAYLIAKLLGSVYQPNLQRPFEILGLSAGASFLPNPGFPSDHALFAAFLTFAVWFNTKSRNVIIALIVLTIFVSLGRVLALVHTPLDVIAAIVISGIGALWYVQAKKHLHGPMDKNTKM